MARKAIVTGRSGDGLFTLLDVEHDLPGRAKLVRLPEAQAESTEPPGRALESQGYRVKLLEDTNLLNVGKYSINVEGGAEAQPLPDSLTVPSEAKATWPHHLVQLAGPPLEKWVRDVEATGVDVAEPISAYGLFVFASPQQMPAVRALSFVEWVGLFEPAYRLAENVWPLRGSAEVVRVLNVGVYPDAKLGEVRAHIEQLGGKVLEKHEQNGVYRDLFGVCLAELPGTKIDDLARHPFVRWISLQKSELSPEDERSSQIVVNALNSTPPPDTETVPGYQNSLTGLGVSGRSVRIGICDTGVDRNSTVVHPDLAGRLANFHDVTGGLATVDSDGHGTHVAGIALGSGGTGDTDPQGYLLGIGAAPAADFVVTNPVGTPGSPGLKSFGKYTKIMVANGAHVMNNSWYQGTAAGYSANAAAVDRLMRDPNGDNWADPARTYLAIVFSAGNKGPSAGSITEPKEAKNPIVVGNSNNFRPGEAASADIRALKNTSSRGPAADGRILPTIVAPGTFIISARANGPTNGSLRPRLAYSDTAGNSHPNHTEISGTSMSAPLVTGLCALLIEWWRGNHDGANPSPALLKALLVNGAEDLAGGPDGNGGTLAPIPNNHQGWGRVCLRNIIQCSNKVIIDQTSPFTQAGQEFLIKVTAVVADKPLRITLAWTDPPGAANARPALVNDLDLEITTLATGDIFKGNVFAGGFSQTGGSFDTRNNLECVYLRQPGSGDHEIRVIASTLTLDARPPFNTPAWQDFVLVIDNARQVP